MPQTKPAKALILAAGFGKRMGRYTSDLPKPLLPVNEVPLLEYTLFQLFRWGISNVYVNLHYLGEKIERFLKGYPWFRFTFLREDPILGTAGALRTMGELMPQDEPLLLINPDRIFFSHEEIPFLDAHFDTSLFVLPKPSDSAEPGWVKSKGSNAWTMNRNGGDFLYCGVSVVRPGIVSGLKKNTFAELGPVWENLAVTGKLTCHPWQSENFDAGDLAAYEKIRSKHLMPPGLKQEWAQFKQNSVIQAH